MAKLGIESYLGSYLLSSTYETLGIVAVMGPATIYNAAFIEHLILVLSPAFEEILQRLTEPV
ncbi:hypothetical protein [Pontibacter pudoricolor]|uniref:hypothetical protein n=1 Tax=Pontibacter pudoricolor TaxID=2694930 RepID=UPI001391A113|nr:hypothetical protein [Pontibacter pudoricolor]